MKLENGIYSNNDNPRDREYHCSISRDDVIESEKYRQLVYISSACNKPLYKYQRDMLDSMLYGIHFKNNNYINLNLMIVPTSEEINYKKLPSNVVLPSQKEMIDYIYSKINLA